MGVAYNADIDVVKKVLGDVIAADKRIMHAKGVTVRLNEMAPSSLNFVTRSRPPTRNTGTCTSI